MRLSVPAGVLLVWWFPVFCSALVSELELIPYESEADPAATLIVGGRARFTVLTPRLVRAEYDKDGIFESRPTLAIVNRRTDVPTFHATAFDGPGSLRITTQYFNLTYGGGMFTSTSLIVQPTAVDSCSGVRCFSEWRFGMDSTQDPGNLRGTFRTLDLADNETLACAHTAREHCAPGLISRTGWALVDESGAPVLDASGWWADAGGQMLRSSDQVDVYLFAHGLDYAAALRDFGLVSGRAALPPRWALGIWLSRWYDYAQGDALAVVGEAELEGLPVDVFVLDMNWHTKASWTGYSWDHALFPDPSTLLGALHARGLRVSLNLHDALGVGEWEDAYLDFCTAIGVDPDAPSGGDRVPLDLTSASRLAALDDVVLGPLELQGVDLWWIDWQQGEAAAGTGQDGPLHRMNPTIALARARATDARRRCARGAAECSRGRGAVLTRWGGLGAHRYPLGFSGDVKALTWANMAYQAYFTATAANVAFGTWSHDVVGPGNDPELLVRWIQLTAFSPVVRLHDRGLSAGPCADAHWPSARGTDCAVSEVSDLPRAFRAVARTALRRRAALVPYVYTAMRAAVDSAASLCRPLYWDFANEADAYPRDMDADLGQTPATSQFLFGPHLVIAPATSPGRPLRPDGEPEEEAEPASGAIPARAPSALSSLDVWVPPGLWLDTDTSALLRGPATIRRRLHLEEVPVLARLGSAVPLRPMRAGPSLGLARLALNHVAWDLALDPSVAQGGEGFGELYEDDGETTDYVRAARDVGTGGGAVPAGTHAWTRLRFAWHDRATLGVRPDPPPASSASEAHPSSGRVAFRGGVLAIAVWTNGSYPGLPPSRPYTFRLPRMPPPESAKAMECELGQDCPCDGIASADRDAAREDGERLGGADGRGARQTRTLPRVPSWALEGDDAFGWTFDADSLSPVVQVQPLSPDHVTRFATTCVLISFGPNVHPGALDGLRGLVRRATLAKAVLDEVRAVPGGSHALKRDEAPTRKVDSVNRPMPAAPAISRLASAGASLAQAAGGADMDAFNAQVHMFKHTLFKQAADEVAELVQGAETKPARARRVYAAELLNTATSDSAPHSSIAGQTSRG